MEYSLPFSKTATIGLPMLCDFADEFLLPAGELKRVGVAVRRRRSWNHITDPFARDGLIASKNQYNYIG